jgi:NADH:ubiquinone oxidoreductase subunit K
VNIPDRLTRWRAVAGLDFHVLVTLLFRGWAIVAGGATVFLLPLWLSPTEQGYYFTFASVLALQIFFELGLNQIVVQQVSHELAHLTEAADGRLTGEESHLGRLSSLARLISRWYSVAALLFVVIGGISGTIFFLQKGTEPLSVWLGIWVVLVCATAVNLWLSPGLAVMEGCSKVGQVARLRLVQSVLGYAILWATLLSGGGLWVVTVVPLVSALCTGYWLRAHGDMLRWLSTRAVDIQNQLIWSKDVLPLQWRIALSWASGYLIFNLFTPMVFSHHGAIEAGRLGMALTVFSAISTIGMSWVNAKAPNFTTHIARGERRELNILFKALLFRSTLVIALTSAGVVLSSWYLNQIGVPQMMRIASPSVLAVLAVTTTVNSIVFSMAIYMRAHREEPMLTQSIVVGLMIASGVYIGSIYGILTMMLFYMLISLFISLPWTIWLFFSYWRIKKLSATL